MAVKRKRTRSRTGGRFVRENEQCEEIKKDNLSKKKFLLVFY